jgi:hypothetical protein
MIGDMRESYILCDCEVVGELRFHYLRNNFVTSCNSNENTLQQTSYLLWPWGLVAGWISERGCMVDKRELYMVQVSYKAPVTPPPQLHHYVFCSILCIPVWDIFLSCFIMNGTLHICTSLHRNLTKVTNVFFKIFSLTLFLVSVDFTNIFLKKRL